MGSELRLELDKRDTFAERHKKIILGSRKYFLRKMSEKYFSIKLELHLELQISKVAAFYKAYYMLLEMQP